VRKLNAKIKSKGKGKGKIWCVWDNWLKRCLESGVRNSEESWEVDEKSLDVLEKELTLKEKEKEEEEQDGREGKRRKLLEEEDGVMEGERLFGGSKF
jgi:hypothetical protein